MSSRLKQIPESLLAKLWKERVSREESFRAGNGRRFKVIYSGRQCTGAGPDFRDAVLEEEGVGLVRGDVELHVKEKDWKAHGHNADPRYNSVVLHVVAGMDAAYTTLENGSQVPVLSLGPLLDCQPSPGGPQDLWPLLKVHGYTPPTKATEMGVLLDRAGDTWFLGESDGFLALLKEEDPEQVLYASLMEALGYSQNRGHFQELACRVPYHLLKRVAMASPPGESLQLIESLLMTTAGFLPASPNTRPVSPGTWHLFRVRPLNHPWRRIMGFAQVLDRFLPCSELDPPAVAGGIRQPDRLPRPGNPWATEAGQGGPRPSPPLTSAGKVDRIPAWSAKGLLEGVTRLVEASSRPVGSEVCSRVLEGGLMSSYTPATGRTGTDIRLEKGALIGRGRARDMAVNCVLPFVHALAQLKGDGQLAHLSLKLYHVLPRLQENELTRETGDVLFSDQGIAEAGGPPRRAVGAEGAWRKVVCSARRQQGLLHLHRLMASPVTSSAASPRSRIRRGNLLPLAGCGKTLVHGVSEALLG